MAANEGSHTEEEFDEYASMRHLWVDRLGDAGLCRCRLRHADRDTGEHAPRSEHLALERLSALRAGVRLPFDKAATHVTVEVPPFDEYEALAFGGQTA
jgi:hypothetical protein